MGFAHWLYYSSGKETINLMDDIREQHDFAIEYGDC